MIWGLAGAGAVTLYLSRMCAPLEVPNKQGEGRRLMGFCCSPRFQKDVLHKVPVINTYFMDNTPDVRLSVLSLFAVCQLLVADLAFCVDR